MARLLKKLPGVRRHILLSATEGAIDHGPLTIDHSWKRINFLHKNSPSSTVRSALPLGSSMNGQCSMVNGQCSTVSERVKAYVVKSPVKDKLTTLRQLLCDIGGEQSVVFLGFRDAVERVGDYLRREGFAVSVFHGGMEQKQREDALYKFSNGSANVFVSTDLGSRGLDIPDVQNIIHYHLPLHEQELVHRIGRTARWDKQGRTFFIVGPEEQLPEFVIDHSPLTIDHSPLTIDHSAAQKEADANNGQCSMVNVQSYNEVVKRAAYEAGKRRMVPIFLTTATTAVGVVPMIIAQSSFWMPVGVTIFAGGIGSLIMVVTMLPVVYWKVSTK